MQKRIAEYVLIMAVFFWVPVSSTGAVNIEKVDLLEQRIAGIQALQERIDDIGKQAVTLHGELQAKAEEYAGEIRKEKRARALKSFNQAIRVYRVRYNLKLVQQISAYLAAVSERIEFFRDGRERIDFLYQQARDDLKMVQTLSDMEIADFIRRIDQVLEKYELAVNSPLFTIEEIRQENLETLWKTISASANHSQ
jgi:hypothetical protein